MSAAQLTKPTTLNDRLNERLSLTLQPFDMRHCLLVVCKLYAPVKRTVAACLRKLDVWVLCV